MTKREIFYPNEQSIEDFTTTSQRLNYRKKSKEVGVVKEDKEVKGDKDNRKKQIGSSIR